jgi:hypothetical protein
MKDSLSKREDHQNTERLTSERKLRRKAPQQDDGIFRGHSRTRLRADRRSGCLIVAAITQIAALAPTYD